MMYRCTKCDKFVEDKDRTAHSESAVHQSNGGNAEVDEEDYEEEVPRTRGMSKT